MLSSFGTCKHYKSGLHGWIVCLSDALFLKSARNTNNAYYLDYIIFSLSASDGIFEVGTPHGNNYLYTLNSAVMPHNKHCSSLAQRIYIEHSISGTRLIDLIKYYVKIECFGGGLGLNLWQKT